MAVFPQYDNRLTKMRVIAARSLFCGEIKSVFMALKVLMSPSKYYTEKQPDFLVVGCQKAGTYWLTNILNGHPAITCFPTQINAANREVHFFDSLAFIEQDINKFRRRIYYKYQNYFSDLASIAPRLNTSVLYSLLCMRYNALVQSMNSKTIVGEKTPEYVLHLDLITRLYPKIKLICLLRDPRDRIVSFHFHQIRKGRIAEQAISDSEVIEYIARVKEELRQLTAFKDRVFITSYEAMKADTVGVTKKILTYLGVDADDAIAASIVDKASFDRLIKQSQQEKTDSASHYRKGIVGDYVQHLSSHQLSLIDESLGDYAETQAKFCS